MYQRILDAMKELHLKVMKKLIAFFFSFTIVIKCPLN